MGVKHPLRTVQRKGTPKMGAEKNVKKRKKKAGREEEDTEKAEENIVTKDRLSCKNIGSVCNSSIKPYLS